MYFLKDYTASNSKLGQYFTPPKYIHLIIEYLQSRFNISERFKNKKIGDPFMGTGKMISMLLNKVKIYALLLVVVLVGSYSNTIARPPSLKPP